MNTKYITVLNHIDGEVYQHKLPFKFRDPSNCSTFYLYDTSEIEDWLWDNGYSLGNVEWMVHEHPVVVDGDRDCECKQCCNDEE